MAEQSTKESSSSSNDVNSTAELSEEAKDELLARYKHLIQPCKIYRGEHKECTRIKGRFNQYFVFGQILDCQHWAQDYNNCQKYNWFENKDAAVELIKSELERREKRLKAHYANDIWKKRESPPDDWNKPLPAFIVERNKNSFLELKKKESLGEKFTSDDNKKFCTFM